MPCPYTLQYDIVPSLNGKHYKPFSFYILSYVESYIPEDIKNRVFVLGVQSNPENLKRDIRKNFEAIGDALATDCAENKNELWGHHLLKHNKTELERMILSVKPFLFKQ